MKIEKNVPRPILRKSYAWGEMVVDDSVFFDNEPKGTQSKQAIGAGVWGGRNGAKFSARKEGNGVRIWRVA
jgi:hypothetical protein